MAGKGIVLFVEENPQRLGSLIRQVAEQLQYDVKHCDNMDCARKLVEEFKENIFAVILNMRLSQANYSPFADICSIPTIVVNDGLPLQTPVLIRARNVLDYVMDYAPHTYPYFIQLLRRAEFIGQIEILVVENEATTRNLVSHMLKRAGFHVLEAKNGKEGLALLESHEKVRLVLCDMDMPVMGGEEFIFKARAQYNKQELPIIGLADSVLDEVGVQFLRLGANDYVEKPPRLEEFLTRVNQNLELTEAFHEIREMSRMDFLSGLYNRRHFFELAEPVQAHRERGRVKTAVAMLDLDNFKKVNDSYGHGAGDVAIIEIAEILRRGTRETDIVSRFGGEEFCILFSGLETLEDSLLVMNRILKSVEEFTIRVEGFEFSMTVSAGLCTDTELSLDEMISKADTFLYEAKNNGKNQVISDLS